MSTPIISGEEVRRRMADLSLKDLETLAEKSKVPFTTLYKIKRGETLNPGLETVRAFIQHLPADLGIGTEGAPEPTAEGVW